jgi:hypothetical protein
MCAYDGLDTKKSQELNSRLDNIRFGMNLRKWIKQFALQAYRSDPMGIILIEVDKQNNPYPTYKCISSVFDYDTIGRQLEYLCLQLTKEEVLALGIQDKNLDSTKQDATVSYFRFIDDQYDYIFKLEQGKIIEQGKEVPTNEFTQLLDSNGKGPLKLSFKKLPAFIISDIIAYDNTKQFISPLDYVIELADAYKNDRSVRDLQKKYTGFLKSIEPLLQCETCNGSGFLSSSACPACTPPGAKKGSGFKLHTKVADVARFSMAVLKEGFDYRRIFGYVDVPVNVWNKQDTSLNDMENMISDVYWGTSLRASTNGPEVGATNIEETATKTLANLQPIYARLNMTADWAQQTENIIIDFIGSYVYPDVFVKSSNTYGRYYILETPFTLMQEYTDMKKSGVSQTTLTEALKRYYHSTYKDNPIKLAIMIKLMQVEPFVHNTILDIKPLNTARIDYVAKLYFNEWLTTQTDEILLGTPIEKLIASLSEFANEKLVLMNGDETENDLRNTVGGLTGFIEIIKAIGDGYYTEDAAAALISDRFGITIEDAKIQLGVINKVKGPEQAIPFK